MTDDYQNLLKKAELDIKIALNIWKELFVEIWNEDIEYAYAKGSGVKKWDSLIDYVPILSDLDIHVMYKEYPVIFNNKDLFSNIDQASNIVKEYENRFRSLNKNPLHLPRMQITILNKYLNDEEFNIIKIKANNKLLIDNSDHYVNEYSNDNTKFDLSKIRNIDRKRLVENKEFFNSLPEKLFDRTELDLWNITRRMNWRVSPTPIRLLTQLEHIDPMDAWTWNRTKICKILRKNNYNGIADTYEAYYKICWKLFLSKFKKTEYYHDLLKMGAKTIYLSISSLKDQKIIE